MGRVWFISGLLLEFGYCGSPKKRLGFISIYLRSVGVPRVHLGVAARGLLFLRPLLYLAQSPEQ